jgi:hypothetical protein
VSCSVEIPALGCRGDDKVVAEHDVGVEGLHEVERNLCGFTMGATSMRI